MDAITTVSPKRLIVADFVHEKAKELFGNNYEYRLCVSTHDPLERLNQIKKPIWSTILGNESTDIHSVDGTLENEVLINVSIIARVESNNIIHSIPYLNDIETMKKNLVGKGYSYKDSDIWGNISDSNRPVFSAWHDIDYSFGTAVLRCQFAIILKIYTEVDDA